MRRPRKALRRAGVDKFAKAVVADFFLDDKLQSGIEALESATAVFYRTVTRA